MEGYFLLHGPPLHTSCGGLIWHSKATYLRRDFCSEDKISESVRIAQDSRAWELIMSHE
jgi:hypothetical protein